MRRILIYGYVLLAVLTLDVFARGPEETPVAIRGAKILTMEGETIEKGTIVIRGAKIESVGTEVTVPADATIFDAGGLTAMPGIVDAEGIAPGHQISGIEGTMRAELIAGDFFDPYGRDYRPERALRDLAEWGVTAINTKLTDTNVFDGVSSVVKIHAPTTYEDHFVKYRAALRINLGEPPRSEERKFPTTRMGIVGMVRENFIKAQAYREKWKEWEEAENGGDQDNGKSPPAKDYKMEHLTLALDQEIPVIVHAVEPMDIETAIRIADEFNLRLVLSASSMTLEAQVPALLKRKIPVILGTYYAHINNHIGEQTEFRYETAAMLAERGVPIAFGGLKGETKLLLVNAGIAVQNGMPYEKALESLTLNPARMLGVEDRVGSLSAGKDADIVLYRGDPLEIASPVEKVFISGQLVYEKAPFDPTYHNMKH